jgi:hypothetical protein
VSAGILHPTAGKAQTATQDWNSGDVEKPDRFAILVNYMPRWVADFGDGEPDYHFLLAGGRYRITRRVNVALAVGFYQNGNARVGPDLRPIHAELQIDLHTSKRTRLFLQPALTLYYVTETNQWISGSGDDLIVGVGGGGGFGLSLAPGFNVVVEAFLYVSGTEDWQRDWNQWSEPVDEQSETNFSGGQVMGGVEIAF